MQRQAKRKSLKESVRQDTRLSQAPKTLKRQITKSLTEKVSRYARLKATNDTISTWISLNHEDFGANQAIVWKAGMAMHECGLLLLFRQYLGVADTKLVRADFCNKHLLCPLCAAARASKLLRRFVPAVFGSADASHYMLTLTWPSGPDLVECLRIGQEAISKLWERQRRKKQGPLKNVLGMVVATEVTRSAAGWHPHFHILVTLPRRQRIDISFMRQEWDKLTRGRQIRIDPIKDQSGLVEVLKYSLKPVDLKAEGGVIDQQIRDRVEAFIALRGKRLLRSFGCYFDMDQEPDQLTDQELDLPYIEYVFRWWNRSYRVGRLERFNAEGHLTQVIV